MLQKDSGDDNHLLMVTNHLNVFFTQPTNADPDIFGTPDSTVSMRVIAFPIGSAASYLQVDSAVRGAAVIVSVLISEHVRGC